VTLFEDQFELSSASIAEVRHWVRDRCYECQASDRIDLDKVEIAVGEVLQNIIRYAYSGPGPTDIRVCDLAECVSITVFDQAPPNPIDQWKVQPEGTDGGFGLNLIKECSDAHRFRALKSGNRCSLYFFVDPVDLPFESLLWAGELLEARAASESMMDLCRWTLREICNEHGFVLISTAIDFVYSFEESSERIPPYHNTSHFRDVLITVCHAIESEDLQLSEAEALGMVLAAILHDFAHPGRSAQFLGEIEKSTVAQVEALWRNTDLGGFSDAIDICLDLIKSTSPVDRKTAKCRLGKMFNACDIGPSFISLHGITQAQNVAEELGETTPEVWKSFLATWHSIRIEHPAFVERWREKCCS